ncbi:MAG: lamin tail domain-containing protein [Flavobacteriia bacterium]|jgi:hypothetical protein
MKKILILLFLSSFSFAFNQINDDFSDNDFTANPVWLGDDSVFVVADDGGNLKLRSNKIIANSTFYLSTANALVTNTQFEFSLKLAFSTSSTNYVDIYVNADQSDLLSATLNGYFVRVGETTDEVSFWKMINGTPTKIIDGIDGSLGSSSNLKIKVICSATNDWSLERDLTGTGSSYVLEGSVNNSELVTSSFFGIKIRQSTASFFQKHFLDNVYVGPIILDVTPPSIVSATVIDANNFDVLFSESVDQTSAENLVNYSINPSLGITNATRDAVNFSLVHINTSSALINGTNYTLTATNISDLNANIMLTGNTIFSLLVGETPSEGDVIITEFFCDPSPKIGLAEIEFVEIYNKSNKIFHLEDWQLGDNATSGTISDAWILPGEYKVLVTTSAIDSFPNAIAVSSFPSLNNTGDNIVLRDTGSVIIDSLTFTDSWYHDDIKAEGGYTIELINQNDPCSGEDNWSASNSLTGGTPGSQNSIFDNTPDSQAPTLVSLRTLAPNFLVVKFSEGMDSLSLVNALVTTNPSLTVSNIFALSQFPDSIIIAFNENFVGSQVYQFQIQNVADCWNNSGNLSGEFILAEAAVQGDLVINEILSDSYTGASDFIEIRNNSTKVIDVFGYQLANYDDTIANNKTITEHYNLKANDFVVITPDSNSVKNNYPATVGGKFIQMSLPTYSNDSSTVYLLNGSVLVDNVSYKSDWQFALLNDTDGKSLERIDPFGPSNDKNNWHTASENIGFATPGKENSQILYGENDGVVNLTNPIFSPDNDGFEDVLQINYEMINAGMLASISVFDDRGREIKKLVKSELIGSKGTFTWDGVTDNNQKASIGSYVLLFNAFDLSGKQISEKIAFVIGGKL